MPTLKIRKSSFDSVKYKKLISLQNKVKSKQRKKKRLKQENE